MLERARAFSLHLQVHISWIIDRTQMRFRGDWRETMIIVRAQYHSLALSAPFDLPQQLLLYYTQFQIYSSLNTSWFVRLFDFSHDSNDSERARNESTHGQPCPMTNQLLSTPRCSSGGGGGGDQLTLRDATHRAGPGQGTELPKRTTHPPEPLICCPFSDNGDASGSGMRWVGMADVLNGGLNPKYEIVGEWSGLSGKFRMG